MFANVTEDDISSLLDEKDSKSTKRCVARSVNSFRSFLGDDSDFETFPKDKLNTQIRLYFASLRKSDGSHLKKASIVNIRYGLAKYLKEKCSIDINDDIEFASSKDVFRAVLVDLKKKGYGGTDHKPPISKEDLTKMYNAFTISTPCGLLMKVWFDITFYMCRRGRENQRSMTKNTFAIETDSSGREYVFQKVDECDKNHRDAATPDDTVGESRMYAKPNDPLCPVKSFKMYLNKLNPNIDDLWQRPKDKSSYDDDCWFSRAPLGKNTLSNMMPEISDRAELSQRYTNHSVRATAICTMDNAGVEARHIMRASGHRSESSIRSYSSRLSENKQREMSDSLNSVLQNDNTSNTVNNTISTTESEKSTKNDCLFGLNSEEIESLLSDPQTVFEEIPATTNNSETNSVSKQVNVQMQNSNIVQNKENVPTNFQMSMNNVQPWCNNSTLNLCPNISHCVVNFNIQK